MQNSDSAAIVPLLWTGGWDSTFRLLVLLLHERRIVQPYYIVDRLQYRPGVPEEQAAMQRIRAALAARSPQAAARLRTTIECAMTDIQPHAALNQAYEGCLTFGFIGGQYEWLAAYCAAHRIDGMELSIHRDDKARDLLAPLIDASRTRLDAKHQGDPRYELFKGFRLPLFDLSKQNMRAVAQAGGFEDLMRMTWFCHTPRRHRPCGTCNPCIYTIEEGLADRVPFAGRLRYHLRIVPRARRWLTRHPDLYLKIRALYRRVRPRTPSAAEPVRARST